MKKNVLIVGAGFSGAVCARILAEHNYNVRVIDKRPHIGGNMYDYKDEYGIIVHKYGPHILVVNDEKIFNFLSKFTDWKKYEHHVKALVDGQEVILPINFNSLAVMFPNDYVNIKNSLLKKYSEGQNIPILDLLNADDPLLKNVAHVIYNKIFVDYTAKMWGKSPQEIDPSITARIPIRLSYDNRHFLHKYQYMPKNGYTAMFERIFDHSNIKVDLSVNASDVMSIDSENSKIVFNCDDHDIPEKVVYTGPLDELLLYKYGSLDYRSLKFEIEHYNKDEIQDVPVLNWPDKRSATRRTEMKKLTQQIVPGITTTLCEYPGAYDKKNIDYCEPYYPLLDEHNQNIYNKYYKDIYNVKNLFLVGRLAEYKYYNMEAAISAAMSTCERIIE